MRVMYFINKKEFFFRKRKLELNRETAKTMNGMRPKSPREFWKMFKPNKISNESNDALQNYLAAL